MKENREKLLFILSMVIFGSIGLFRRYIELSSSLLASVRGVLGALTLLLVLLIKKQPIDTGAIRKSAVPLCVSGLFIGINWILLFEAYNYTTVAVATLCYYFAPIIVILLSPFVLSEKLTARKLICALAALLGMALVSGIRGAEASVGDLKGVLLGLGAAVFYAFIILINKKCLGDTPPYETTVTQLFAAGVCLIPYVLVTGALPGSFPGPGVLALLLTVSFVHTGLAYWLYFRSVKHIPAQSAAIFSYIDPIVAIFLSALLLKEPMTPGTILGAVLILGAAILCER